MTNNTRKLAAAAVVGAAYAALTMALAVISYAPVQFRVSEALCVLPFFMPCTAWGLFIGCAVANLISTAWVLDVVFGSLATLLATLCAAALGRAYRKQGALPGMGRCLAVCAMPALFNGPIIGAVLAYTSLEGGFWAGFAVIGAQIFAEELAVMLVLGLPLMRLIVSRPALRELCGRFGD